MFFVLGRSWCLTTDSILSPETNRAEGTKSVDFSQGSLSPPAEPRRMGRFSTKDKADITIKMLFVNSYRFSDAPYKPFRLITYEVCVDE